MTKSLFGAGHFYTLHLLGSSRITFGIRVLIIAFSILATVPGSRVLCRDRKRIALRTKFGSSNLGVLSSAFSTKRAVAIVIACLLSA